MSKPPKVSSLTVKRDGNKYTATWKVSSKFKDAYSKLRASFRISRAGKDETGSSEKKDSDTSYSKSLTRKNYYPTKGKPKVSSITFKVAGLTSNGKVKSGSEASETYEFSKPKAPSVGDLSLDETTQGLTSNVKTDAGTGKAERYDTCYEVRRSHWSSDSDKATNKVVDSGSKTSTDFNVTWDDDKASSIAKGQWIKVEVRAWARGLAGDSAKVAKSHVFAWPAKAQITAEPIVSIQNGTVNVPVQTNHDATKAPVDEVQLIRYIGTAMDSNMGNWTEVKGSVDNANCTGLWDTVSDASPSVDGEHVWYALRTTHDNRIMYSDPVEATALFKMQDTSAASVASVKSATNGNDGQSVTVTVEFTADEANAYDGTTLSWSTDQMAWRSTEEPDRFDMDDVTWKDADQESEDKTTATIKVMGLEDGGLYWFRARRYNSATNAQGAWSEAVSCKVTSLPSSVSIRVPSFVQAGDPIQCSWTIGGDAVQTEWHVLVGSVEVASGYDDFGGCVIPASRLDGMTSAEVSVMVSTGGDFVTSESQHVEIVQPPSITAVDTGAAITASGHALTVTCDTAAATVAATLASNGVSSSLPDGDDVQAAGEAVWSASEGVDADGTASFSIPDTVHLIDGSEYILTLVPSANGIAGEPYTATLPVAWEHQAVAPESCTVVVDEEADTATVTPIAPVGIAITDVFDLYRVTLDGAQLIASGLRYGVSVTDRWPPYTSENGLAYRVATRTADGDVDWRDFGYSYDRKTARVDWPGGNVELEYSLALSASWAKGFEAVEYIGESYRVGSWSDGVERSGSVSGSVIRDVDRDTLASLSSLGSYAGSAFVRTPDGRAVEANVDVGSIDQSADSRCGDVSLTITAVALTDYVAESEDIAAANADDVFAAFAMESIAAQTVTVPGTASVAEGAVAVIVEADGSRLVEGTDYELDGSTVSILETDDRPAGTAVDVSVTVWR